MRSGVLTSVHSFASDPTRGVFILLILVVFIGGSLALYAWRAPVLRQGGLFAPVSREGALVLNNLLLTTCCATVLTGTLYPLALEALTGDKISVGAPFFNLTFGPLMVPLLLVMPLGQSLAWKRGDLLGAAQRLVVGGGARRSLAASCCSRSRRGGPVLAPLGVGLAVYLDRRRLRRRRAAALRAGRAARRPCSSRAAGPAALGLGHGLRPCRPRRHACSAWRRPAGASSGSRPSSPGETVDLGPYQVTVDGSSSRARARTTREIVGRIDDPAGRQLRRHDRARQAHFPDAPDDA